MNSKTSFFSNLTFFQTANSSPFALYPTGQRTTVFRFFLPKPRTSSNFSLLNPSIGQASILFWQHSKSDEDLPDSPFLFLISGLVVERVDYPGFVGIEGFKACVSRLRDEIYVSLGIALAEVCPDAKDDKMRSVCYLRLAAGAVSQRLAQLFVGYNEKFPRLEAVRRRRKAQRFKQFMQVFFGHFFLWIE